MVEAQRPMRTEVVPEICLDGAAAALNFYEEAFGAEELFRHALDVDASVERAVAAGATLLHGPEDMFWGDRYARLVDPYGHHWSLATPGPGPDLEATAVAEAQFDKMLDTP